LKDWNWELIIDHGSLTEGPTWTKEGLLYSQCDESLTWIYNSKDGSNKVWRKDTNGSNGMLLDTSGNLYACEGAGRRLVRYEKDVETEVIASEFEGSPFNEPNDLAIYPDDAHIWFSDPNYGGRDLSIEHESVYLASKNESEWLISRATFDTDRPNGVLLSKDSKKLYVANSPHNFDNPEIRRELRSYEIKPDFSLGEYEVLHDFGPHRGVDGMTLDSNGNIVATAGFDRSGPGPMIYHFEEDGRVIDSFKTPSDYPTNCTFGGDDQNFLFVTFGTGALYQIRDTGLKGLRK